MPAVPTKEEDTGQKLWASFQYTHSPVCTAGGPLREPQGNLQPPTPYQCGSVPPATRRGQAPPQMRKLRLRGAPTGRGQGHGPMSLMPMYPTPRLAEARPRPRPGCGPGRLPRILPCEPDTDQLPSRPGQVIQSKCTVGTASRYHWADVPAWPSGGPTLPDLGLCALWTEAGVRGPGDGEGGPVVPGTSRQQELTWLEGEDRVKRTGMACAGCHSRHSSLPGPCLPPRQPCTPSSEQPS